MKEIELLDWNEIWRTFWEPKKKEEFVNQPFLTNGSDFIHKKVLVKLINSMFSPPLPGTVGPCCWRGLVRGLGAAAVPGPVGSRVGSLWTGSPEWMEDQICY